MSNWFKKQSEIGDTPVVYSVMIPIDIKVSSSGDTFTDQENVYNILEGLLSAGAESQRANYEGFRSNLQLNHIKPRTGI